MSASQPLDLSEPGLSRPALLVFAGPSGSGKSGLKADLERRGRAFDRHIDARDIAGAIGGEEPVTRARAEIIAAELRRRCMALGEDFSIETDLARADDIELMQKAKEDGFEIVLYFVALHDPSLNRARLESRAEQTGEQVPTADIYTSYWQIMRHLADAAWTADRTYLFDNSADGQERKLMAECENGTITLYADPAPSWVNTFFIAPLAGDS